MTADVASVKLTRHALDVMRRRMIDGDEVGEAIRNPDVTEPHKGMRRYVKGGLAVVVAEPEPGHLVVVTVLLRERGKWTDDDARRRA